MYESGLLRLFQTESVLKSKIMDWDSLVHNADAHKVTELVAGIIRKASGEAIPDKVRNYLYHSYYKTLSRNMFFRGEIEEVLRDLGNCKIRCIILKGVPLAERLYNDSGLRKSGDIDLLVEECNVAKAMHVLIKRGYTEVFEIEVNATSGKHHHLLRKETPNGPIFLELHFHLTPYSGKHINMSDIWARTRTVAIGKAVSQDLATSDLVFYLCVHSADHGLHTLRTVLDIAQVLKVEGSQVDWKEFVAVVKKYRISNRVYIALYYAVFLLKASIPVWVLNDLQPPGYLRRRILTSDKQNRLPEKLDLVTLMMIRHEDFRGFLTNMLKYIVRSVFPSLPVLRLKYHLGDARPACLYYPVRWYYLLRKALTGSLAD